MDIVINSCFGGFSLSPIAEKRYAELKGMELYFYISKNNSGRYGFEKMRKVAPEDIEPKRVLFWHTFTKDLGEAANTREYPEGSYFISRDIPRNDPLLIQVIRELGQKANGTCAALKIVEIPDGVDWQIEEYDGSEWIAERHQTWC